MKKQTILVIEDNEDVRSLVASRLAKSGFKVECVADGESGLARARRIFPDLILLDLGIPKLSGEEVCKAVREDHDKKFANTPILMLTAKTADVDRVIGHVIGANTYMTKPFEAVTLMKEINLLVEPACLPEAGPIGVNAPREGVLIVEDDSDTAELLKSRLASVGLEAHVASSGQSALDYASGHRPELVLMDLKLPDIPGQEVTSRLKRLYSWPLPVVIVTGFDMPTDRWSESGLKVEAYFMKPYDAVELLKTVATLLGRPDISAKLS